MSTRDVVQPREARTPRTRDQQRALHAYRCIGGVAESERKEYKIAVNDLGAIILRSGLAAAMAALERRGKGGSMLLDHLAQASVPDLEGATKADLPKRVRELSVDDYVIATREMLELSTWLKRAVQATFGDD